jgi:hypothetical protein
MHTEPRKYRVTPESELSRLLSNANREPVILENGNMRFRVVLEAEDIWAGYDPDAVIAGIDAPARSITPEEAERMKQLDYDAPEAWTRPITRP